MVALEHALAALAAVARGGDEACGFDQPRIVARADAGHAVFGAGYFLGTAGRGLLHVARLKLEEHFVGLHHAELGARALLDGLRARLEIAHVGIERGVARLELGVRLPLQRELPVGLAHLQPAALAEPHRVLQGQDQDAEDEGEPAHAALSRVMLKNASRPG